MSKLVSSGIIKGLSEMSKFKIGDKVRATKDNAISLAGWTGTISKVVNTIYWVKFEQMSPSMKKMFPTGLDVNEKDLELIVDDTPKKVVKSKASTGWGDWKT